MALVSPLFIVCSKGLGIQGPRDLSFFLQEQPCPFRYAAVTAPLVQFPRLPKFRDVQRYIQVKIPIFGECRICLCFHLSSRLTSVLYHSRPERYDTHAKVNITQRVWLILFEPELSDQDETPTKEFLNLRLTIPKTNVTEKPSC